MSVIIMNRPTSITVAYGDGIGPEIMTATLQILQAAGAELSIETIKIGKDLYEQGISTGIEPSSWESLERTKIFLKAPITTPQGGGVKSLNVTVRRTLGLYANVRPCVSYSPYVPTNHPKMDIVIIRENEEDVYGGIEHQQTPEVVQCLKLISVPGSERIIRYAFEYARQNKRKKVTCFTKDNIMKLTDGLFHKTFQRIAAEYPDLQNEHWIIDIGTAKLAVHPEQFDVIVLENLYGDVLSDVAAEISGSVGICGSSNIGESFAMFEAIHGSAPDIAGKNIANPSGLLLGAVMMLIHIGQNEVAERIHNAWLKTIEDGIHTADVYTTGYSHQLANTQEFAQAVIERLGQKPQQFTPINYQAAKPIHPAKLAYIRKENADLKRELVGVDIFVYAPTSVPNVAQDLAEKIIKISGSEFELVSIANRGTKVWPDVSIPSFCTDHWCCRLLSKTGATNSRAIAALLDRCAQDNIDFIKTENLYNFGGKRGYALGQGE
jgi:isocitrate dehydrogenase